MALTAKRFERKLAVLAKIEADYGTSSAPTGAADAMQMTEVTLTPLAGEEEQRGLLSPYFGHAGILLTGDYAQLEGSVEVAGAGAAGTIPAYGALLRACSMAEVVTPDTSVTYTPVTASPESATLFVNLDGVNHALVGARGTFTVEFATKRIPHIKFTLRGLLGPVADTALPAASYAGFIKPVVVNKTNTALSLFGVAQVAESLTLDMANTLVTRNLIGEDSILITDRQSTGTAVVEAKPLATQDWFAIAQARTHGALALQHGASAGNIVEIAAPALEIGRPTYGATDGIRNLSIPLMLCRDSGDDDFSIVVK
ncbi:MULTISPECIES: phage tail tube protein [unclassified Xanthobacter]|uniref:phage tail tube protein n=1 Tax=unclassified Xanthobacter TaxID=2623496 RepID=UPI001EE0473C|nr:MULTISPECIES: phage tail tube protein [unclassified Xanthobacter]